MADDREVAGIRCMQVLERLSDYLDGELPRAEVERIDAHLRGCDWCDRFGQRFGAVIARVREELGAPRPMPRASAERLAQRLDLDAES